MIIRLFARIRQLAGVREVVIPVGEGQTVGDILHTLVEQYPAIAEAIWREDGSLAGHVAVILNGRDVRHLEGAATPVQDDQTMDVFPPVGGGSSTSLDGWEGEISTGLHWS
jgi:molybdopterin synthase sulfur carrier subunit